MSTNRLGEYTRWGDSNEYLQLRRFWLVLAEVHKLWVLIRNASARSILAEAILMSTHNWGDSNEYSPRQF